MVKSAKSKKAVGKPIGRGQTKAPADKYDGGSFGGVSVVHGRVSAGPFDNYAPPPVHERVVKKSVSFLPGTFRPGSAPKIMVGLVGINHDNQDHVDMRITVEVTNVTDRSFEVIFTTWYNKQVLYFATAEYMAIGERP